MSYNEVLDYWCSPFVNNNIEGLDEQELFKNPTPIIIEGARGSGKTMILKYLSYYCQKDFNQNREEDLLAYFKNKGSIGIYIVYKEDFVNMLERLNFSKDSKNLFFAYYHELLISREILQVIEDLFKETNGLYEGEKQLLINKLSSFFSKEYISLDECSKDISKKINKMDSWINKSRYNQSAEKNLFKMIETESFSSIVSIIRNSIQALRNVIFIIIIDEYENVNKYQKIFNTFIKKVDSSEKITYRIGMRVEGMSTMETDVGNELLQINRDFLLKRLIFTDHNKYKKFLFSISEKRLSYSPFFSSHNLTNIKELLGIREDLEAEAKSILNNLQKQKREKHFDLLKENIKDRDELKYAISELKCPEHPLMEMLNIIWVLRGRTVEETKSQMKEYIDGKADKNSKYRNDYVNKYKYQLIISLLKSHQRIAKKQYYSFNTFAFLSSGSVNDFISLCRHTFYQLDNTYYENINKDKRIPQELQTNGAKITALEQLQNIQLNRENGTEMHTFLLNLGSLFSYIHREKGVKYPETNQFAFENESEIYRNKELYPVLKRLLKWGGIIKKQNMQSISIGQRKGNIYYLNHIFAPLFNISYRIRGGYNPVLSTELFKKMLYNSMEGKDIDNELVVKNTEKAIHPTQQVLSLD